MKTLYSLQEPSNNHITLGNILMGDIVRWAVVCIVIIALNIAIIFLIGSVKLDEPYAYGVLGMANQPIIGYALVLSAAILINWSVSFSTWIVTIASILLFSSPPYNSLTATTLPGTILPALTGVVICYLLWRLWQSIQLRIYYKDSGPVVSWPATALYAGIAVSLLAFFFMPHS